MMGLKIDKIAKRIALFGIFGLWLKMCCLFKNERNLIRILFNGKKAISFYLLEEIKPTVMGNMNLISNFLSKLISFFGLFRLSGFRRKDQHP